MCVYFFCIHLLEFKNYDKNSVHASVCAFMRNKIKPQIYMYTHFHPKQTAKRKFSFIAVKYIGMNNNICLLYSFRKNIAALRNLQIIIFIIT